MECALALRSVVSDAIRRVGTPLSPEEVDEIYSQAAVSLLDYVKGNEINNVLAMLRKIAERRAFDWIRQRSNERRMMEQHASGIVQHYVPTAEKAADPEYRELFEMVESMLSQLPERQRTVTAIWLKGLPDTYDMCFLCELVSEVAKQKMTVTAVKRALGIGRQRIRIALGQKGIHAPGLLGGES